MITLNNERTYGVEVEFLAPVSSQTELVVKLQSKINEHLGIDHPVQLNVAGYSNADSSKWRIKTDSSIVSGYPTREANENDIYHYGYEMVSPILQGDLSMKYLKVVMDAIEQVGGTVNRSCGLHVHVGVSDWKLKHFKNLYKRYQKFEKVIDSFMPNSRKENNNSYCRSIYNYTGRADFDEINSARNLRELSRKATGGDRYVKLNMQSFWKHGTVEFRHHSGTVNFSKIRNWVLVCLAMTKCADNQRSIKLGNVRTHKIQTFFNGLKSTGLIDKSIRLFYNKRVKQCTS